MSPASPLAAAVSTLLSVLARLQGDSPNPAQALRVHVDLDSGRPAAGARVTVAAIEDDSSLEWLLKTKPGQELPGSSRWVHGVADRNGDVELVPVDAERPCAIVAMSPGQRAFVYARWPEASRVTLRLHPPATLNLRVRDSRRRPVAGAIVGIASSDGSGCTCNIKTDASGAAVLEDLDLQFGAITENESFKVLVDVPRGRGTAATIPLPFGGPIDVGIELPPMGSIRVDVADPRGRRVAATGKVTLRDTTRGGEDVRRERVFFAQEVSAPLGPDGTLTFDRVPLDGTYALVGSLDGLGVLETAGAGPTRPDETTTISLTVDDDTPALTGHLVDKHGEPVRRYELDCAIVEVLEGEKDSRVTLPPLRTDEAGGFTIRPKPRDLSTPVKCRFLELEKQGGHWIATLPNQGFFVRQCDRFAQVEISANDLAARSSLGDVILRDAVPLVRGRVIDPDHRPVIGAHVSIHRSGEEDLSPGAPRPWPDLDGASDQEGAFEIVGHLPSSDFELIAMDSHRRWSSPRPVPRDLAPVELMVEPGGSLQAAVEQVPGLVLQVRLRRRHGPNVGRWGDPLDEAPDPHGSHDRVYSAQNVRRGAVDLLVALGRDRDRFIPIRTIEDVEIPSGALTSDRRLEHIEVRTAMRTARLEVSAPWSTRDLEVGQRGDDGRLVSLVPLCLVEPRRLAHGDDVPILQRLYVCGQGMGSLPPSPSFGTARCRRSADDECVVTWKIDYPVAGERWNLVVYVREHALVQIREATGPVTLVLPEPRCVCVRMNPGLSQAESEELRASVRLAPRGVCDRELFVRADEAFRGNEAIVRLLASGPNDLVLTMHSADCRVQVERTLAVDLPDRVEQPPISIPFARELYAELLAQIKLMESR